MTKKRLYTKISTMTNPEYKQPPEFLGLFSLETPLVENPELAEELAYAIKPIIDEKLPSEIMLFDQTEIFSPSVLNVEPAPTYKSAMQNQKTVLAVRRAENIAEVAYYERHGTTKRNVRIFSQNIHMAYHLRDWEDERGDPLGNARIGSLALELAAINTKSTPIEPSKLDKLYTKSLWATGRDFRTEARNLLFGGSVASNSQLPVKLSREVIDAVFSQSPRSLNYINEREQRVLFDKLGLKKVYEKGSWVIEEADFNGELDIVPRRQIFVGWGEYTYVSANPKATDAIGEELALTRERIREIEQSAISKFVMAIIGQTEARNKTI